MPAVPRARGDVIAEAPRGRRPRCGRDAGVPAHVACNRPRGPLTRAEVSPRGDLATAADYVDRIVPSEPEEHTDRPSHRVDVRSRVRIGAEGPSEYHRGPRGGTRKSTLNKVNASSFRVEVQKGFTSPQAL